MTPIADMIEKMSADGVTMATILLAVRTAEQVARSGNSTGLPVDTAAEKRRAYDRERKAKEREIHRTSTGLPPDSVDAHIDTTTSINNKPRKVSISIDAPESPPEEAAQYALSVEWSLSKIQHEWQRFRDHGIVKGRKHKGERGLLAAWRNWVTSPYQKPVESLNVQTSARQFGGAYGASKDRFREARAKLKAFAEQDDGESGGSVVELLPAIGRERA